MVRGVSPQRMVRCVNHRASLGTLSGVQATQASSDCHIHQSVEWSMELITRISRQQAQISVMIIQWFLRAASSMTGATSIVDLSSRNSLGSAGGAPLGWTELNELCKSVNCMYLGVPDKASSPIERRAKSDV